MKISRRRALAGLGLGLVGLSRPAIAQAQTSRTVSLLPSSSADQSALLQTALDAAAQSGAELVIPAGRFHISGVKLPSFMRVRGTPGATHLISTDGGPVFRTVEENSLIIEDVSFSASGAQDDSARRGLVEFSECADFRVTGCQFSQFRGNGLKLSASSGRVTANNFDGLGESAIHSQDATGLLISGNYMQNLGNGGVRVWRHEPGMDGTIVTGNHIANIGSDDGNGQNGNGINIFRADGVIASNNFISGCAFSALRAHSTRDTILSGNQCLDSSEVAIFSEFAFSGSIITENLIDGAGKGISITNFNDGGHLAVCSNNIIRNILPFSPTNPNTRAVGIFAEADVAISGNVIEAIPGIGIEAGWGPFLRDILITNNLVRETKIGIAASVADGAGRVQISGNLVSEAEVAAYAGVAWRDVVSTDLVRDADLYPHVTIDVP